MRSCPWDDDGETYRSVGCRTCRRRHVKCDEARPTCHDCSRLKLKCEYGSPPLSKKQRKLRRDHAARSQPPKALAQAPGKTSRNVGGDLCGPLVSAQAAGWHAPETLLEPPTLDMSVAGDFAMMPNLFPSSLGFFDSLSIGSFMPPSPALDMHFDSAVLLASLPTLTSPTITEREALDYYHKERNFGFGSKSPSWSTHAILWETARMSPAVLHLLFAASQSEIGWRSGSPTHMLESAQNNCQLGSRFLDVEAAKGEVDPLVMFASFWFLHLHYRRPSSRQHVLVCELSHRMAEYIRAHKLHQVLIATGNRNPDWPAAKKALVARLMVWLFWTDTRARTLGDGGTMAKFLADTESQSALGDLYEMSKETLSLNWTQYPDDELVDDIKNSQPLDMIHDTWVLVQRVNNAADDMLPLSPEVGGEILLDIDRFGRRSAVRTLMRLTQSAAVVRDRMMLNSDWAAANYYALRIYHFRCSLTAEDESFSSSGSLEVADTVESLMMLLQRSLANQDTGQSDRLQWPLFWAGVETRDQFKQGFILLELKDQALNAALREIFQGQQTGVRLAMAEIRQVLQAPCVGVLDANVGI